MTDCERCERNAILVEELFKDFEESTKKFDKELEESNKDFDLAIRRIRTILGYDNLPGEYV